MTDEEDNDDRAAILAAMYQPDEAESTSSSVTANVSTLNRSRRIRVGAIEYEVPTIEYVRQLEQSLLQHIQLLNQQRRAFERLLKLMKTQRTTQKSAEREMGDIRRELSRKISQRDAF